MHSESGAPSGFDRGRSHEGSFPIHLFALNTERDTNPNSQTLFPQRNDGLKTFFVVCGAVSLNIRDIMSRRSCLVTSSFASFFHQGSKFAVAGSGA